jgi:hypothetical protein
MTWEIALITVACALVALALVFWAILRLWSQKTGRRSQGFEIVTDLDAILVKTVAFRFQGRTHVIPPVKNEEFFRAMNALARLDVLKKQDVISPEDLLEAYSDLFRITFPSITREYLERMSPHQLGVLFNLVIECIMGKTHVDTEKKSTAKHTAQTKRPIAQRGGSRESGLKQEA